jgi:hypothetical protein
MTASNPKVSSPHFRTAVYAFFLCVVLFLGGYLSLNEYRSGSHWTAVFDFFLTFGFSTLVMAMYETMRKADVANEERITNYIRDIAAAAWSPEQTKAVREDRLDREGYSVSNDE